VVVFCKLKKPLDLHDGLARQRALRCVDDIVRFTGCCQSYQRRHDRLAIESKIWYSHRKGVEIEIVERDGSASVRQIAAQKTELYRIKSTG
jgi:hypothetical protein